MVYDFAERENEELKYRLGLLNLRPTNLDFFREDQRLQLAAYQGFGEDCLAEVPKRPGVSVRFALFDSPDLDAKALLGRVDETQVRFATVSVGALLYFHEFFTYLMSRVDILPSVGFVVSERNLPYKLDPCRSYPPTAHLSKMGLICTVLPNDQLRLHFANIMATTACKFLIFHEIAHCVNGHLEQKPIGLSEEDCATAVSPADTLKHHTLEMDADSYAVCKLFKPSTIFRKPNEKFLWEEALGDHPSANTLYPTFIAVSLLFRIMSRPETLALDQNGLLKGTHPHPAIRAHMCRVLVRRIAIERGSLEADDWISELAVKSHFDASRIWEGLTQLKEPSRLTVFDDSSLRAGFSRVGIYIERLLEEWDLIKPTIQHAALVPIAPTRAEEVESGYQCPCRDCQESRKSASELQTS